MSERNRERYQPTEWITVDGKLREVPIVTPGVNFEKDSKGIIHPLYNRPGGSSRLTPEEAQQAFAETYSRMQEILGRDSEESSNGYSPKSDEYR